MKLLNEYKCDKCGEKLTSPISLTTFYQRGVNYDKRNPHGVKHMCVFCKRIFDIQFKNFFKYNKKLHNENKLREPSKV
tara:strand:+ start:1114 stop:1347 length:234 start_codon:yes stop_codon:yes gene_type:complete